MDGIGETLGSSSPFDAHVPSPVSTPGSPVPQADPTFDLFLRDQVTNLSGLLDLRLDATGKRWFRSRALIRSGRTRTRGDLDFSGGARTGLGDFAAENRTFFQGGPQGGGGWVDDLLDASWRKRGLPGGIEIGLSAAGERSWAAEDSVGELFDYRALRPALDLRHSIGLAGDLSLRLGYGRKWAQADTLGSYRDRWCELSWSQYLAFVHRWSVVLRTQSRSFLRSDSLTPSYREDALEASGEIGIPWHLRLRIEPKARRLAYAAHSALFQDNWTAETALRVEASLRDLRGGGPRDTTVSGADWVLGLGGRYGILRNQPRGDADYHASSALLTLSREGSQRLWFDLTAEAGRRSYRVAGGGQRLIIEGLDLSLFGSDYRFLSTSVLAEASLAPSIKVELFGIYDREDHTEDADDFSLWTFTASVTRSF